VYQWTAALCRIWPSSIPDAKGLSSLLSSAIAGAAQLVEQFPQMQTNASNHSTALCVQNADSVACSSSTEQSAQLAVPVTAAVLEVAALVLQPLGLLLLQQQVALLGEKMLHVDTFATHQWHCLPSRTG
jgi:prophage DNA circulation protein